MVGQSMQEQVVNLISEQEFYLELVQRLVKEPKEPCAFVTGPGRSGALMSVYVSHLTGIPFLPYGEMPYSTGRVLIVDTARKTGATMRKAMRKYADMNPVELVLYEEPPRVTFWYEGKHYG